MKVLNVLLAVKKVVRFIVNTALLVIIVAGLALTVPRLANIKPYVVLSGSMEPDIMTGSIAYVDENAKNPKVGDVITFTYEDKSTTTHRVYARKGDSITTKGDANETIDSPIDIKQLVGTVRFSIPYFGYIYDEATKNAKGSLMILAALVIASFALEGSKKKETSEDKKSEEKKSLPEEPTQVKEKENFEEGRKDSESSSKEEYEEKRS